MMKMKTKMKMKNQKMNRECYLICGEEVQFCGTESDCRKYFEGLLDPLPMELLLVEAKETLIKNTGSTEMEGDYYGAEL